jgi:hypothetical protein
MVPHTEEKSLEPGPGEVLEPTFEEGKPAGPDRWRHKLKSREKMLKYLKTGERYWYAEEGFGSERRRTKA